MGFLKKFFNNVFQEEPPRHAAARSGFERLTQEDLRTHLGIDRYGDFVLSDAVRPSYELEIVPTEGYRHDVYRDEDNHVDVPVLMAAASRERLMETFIDLIEPLGEAVDVVLETSHGKNGGHVDFYREHIDLPILQSMLWDFEDLLINDGCTGIAVLNPAIPQEVQLDEHKLLIAYGKDLKDYEGILFRSNLSCREDMKFITEAEHVHSTTDLYAAQFEELKMRLGMDGYRG
jgi:hypothetical protein